MVKLKSVALSDDSLGGGVGGFSMGVKPLASERWGSRRICPSAAFFISVLTRVPDTVDILLGTDIGSGMYSLVLRFLVWRICGSASLASGCLLMSLAGDGHDDIPAYGFFMLVGCVAELLASLWADTALATAASPDVRLPICFHGPGESLANKGEGRGVTSPMAEITGLRTVELAAEPEPKTPWMLPVLRLGVLEIGSRDWTEDLCCRESAGRFTGLTGVK
jgi:hypothetical protein